MSRGGRPSQLAKRGPGAAVGQSWADTFTAEEQLRLHGNLSFLSGECEAIAAEITRLGRASPFPGAYAARATLAGLLKTAKRIERVHHLLLAVPAPPSGPDLKDEWERLVAKGTADVQRAWAQLGRTPN